MTYNDFKKLMKEFNLTVRSGYHPDGVLMEFNPLGQKISINIVGYRKPCTRLPWKENAIIIFEDDLWTGDFATDVEQARILIRKRMVKEKERRYKNKLDAIEMDFENDKKRT